MTTHAFEILSLHKNINVYIKKIWLNIIVYVKYHITKFAMAEVVYLVIAKDHK